MWLTDRRLRWHWGANCSPSLEGGLRPRPHRSFRTPLVEVLQLLVECKLECRVVLLEAIH